MSRASRPLTDGERALAASVFGDAIDCDSVAIVRRKWFPFQPRHVAMAPSGNIHFHPQGELWSADFSREPLHRQGLLIHEMTHVLQAQERGRFYLPLMRHPLCRYGYEIDPGRRFGRYGLEQQAEMVRHFFLLRHGQSPRGAASLGELEAILPFEPRPQSAWDSEIGHKFGLGTRQAAADH
jgi:hypothetical protein